MMKQTFMLMLFKWTILLGTVGAFSLHSRPSHLSDADQFKLTLLHTNDVHARFEASDKYGGPCAAGKEDQCFGGVARRVTKVKEIRKSTENVLLLDGGDQFQGTLWFVYYKGNATSHFMEKVQYDAMTLGNHEFDNGVEGLGPFLKNASFPIVSANIDASNDKVINGLFNKSTIIPVGGRKIGIVGYTIKETPELVRKGGVVDLVFKDEIPAIQAEVDQLKEDGVNIIIALGHAGFTKDKQVAAEVSGVDVVVGGHSNTFLYSDYFDTMTSFWSKEEHIFFREMYHLAEYVLGIMMDSEGDPPTNQKAQGPYPVVVEGVSGKKVLVVQDFAYSKYLGKLDLVFDASGKLVNWGGNPILLNSSVEEDPEVKAEILEWKKPLEAIAKTQVGTTWVYLEGDRMVCRLEECNMGNVMTDAMLLEASKPVEAGWSDTSIAFWNGGGIRNSIPQGNITLENVLSVFPFRNTISRITMLGKDLMDVLEGSVSNYNPESPVGSFLQMSGVRVTYSLCRPSGERVRKVEVRCSNCTIPEFRPLDPAKIYPMVLSDFLIDGGDNFDMITDAIIEKSPYEILDTTAFEKYAKLRSPITQGLDGRIIFLEDCSTSGAPRQKHSPLHAVVIATVAITALSYYTLL